MMQQVKHLIDTINSSTENRIMELQWIILGPHGIIAYHKHLMLSDVPKNVSVARFYKPLGRLELSISTLPRYVPRGALCVLMTCGLTLCVMSGT